MALKVKVFGVNNVVAFLALNELAIKKGLKDGITESANLLKEEVKESIRGNRPERRSVDTGDFLKSVEIEGQTNDAIIFSNINHAKFLEFGTSRLPERRHFRNTKDRNRNKIMDILNKNIRKSI